MKQLLLGMLALSACGDDRYILVESARSGGWIIDSGSIDISVAGPFVMYPQPIMLRFGIESVVNHDPTKLETRDATVTPFETFSGLPCEVSVAPTCHGTLCETELSVLGAGICMVRIRATTADGEAHGACWYRASYASQDPATLQTEIEGRVAHDNERCMDSFDADSL